MHLRKRQWQVRDKIIWLLSYFKLPTEDAWPKTPTPLPGGVGGWGGWGLGLGLGPSCVNNILKNSFLPSHSPKFIRKFSQDILCHIFYPDVVSFPCEFGDWCSMIGQMVQLQMPWLSGHQTTVRSTSSWCSAVDTACRWHTPCVNGIFLEHWCALDKGGGGPFSIQQLIADPSPLN